MAEDSEGNPYKPTQKDYGPNSMIHSGKPEENPRYNPKRGFGEPRAKPVVGNDEILDSEGNDLVEETA